MFREVLNGALRGREIASQIRRAVGIDARDLSALAEHSADALWLPAAKEQESAEALAKELDHLRWRLRRPAVRAVYELIAHPYLQAVMAIAGLLLVVSSFSSELLPGGDASGWSRLLYYFGVTMLGLALADSSAGYVRTRAGWPVGPVARPLLVTLTGLCAATLGVVEANHLVQFRTGARLVFWAVLLTDAAIVAVRVYRAVSASRAKGQL